MTTRPSPLLLLTLLPFAGAGFVLISGSDLPAVVASHFSAGGVADGFMPRRLYLTFMLALVAFLPLMLGLAHVSIQLIDAEYLNLPDRSYWLAPERVAATLDFLQRQGIHLAAILAAFLCFVHWLVVRANGVQPPHLPELAFIAGSVLFVIGVLVWVVRFLRHFRRRP